MKQDRITHFNSLRPFKFPIPLELEWTQALDDTMSGGVRHDLRLVLARSLEQEPTQLVIEFFGVSNCEFEPDGVPPEIFLSLRAESQGFVAEAEHGVFLARFRDFCARVLPPACNLK